MVVGSNELCFSPSLRSSAPGLVVQGLQACRLAGFGQRWTRARLLRCATLHEMGRFSAALCSVLRTKCCPIQRNVVDRSGASAMNRQSKTYLTSKDYFIEAFVLWKITVKNGNQEREQAEKQDTCTKQSTSRVRRSPYLRGTDTGRSKDEGPKETRKETRNRRVAGEAGIPDNVWSEKKT